jgi:hypothetical protein
MAKKNKKTESKLEIEAPDPSSNLTRAPIEGYLWAAANIPRVSTSKRVR